MPRRIRSSILETRTARLKLAQQRKPYWITVAPGIALGYRRNAGPGAWNVRAADGKGGNWIKSFGIADDHEDADGANVLDVLAGRRQGEGAGARSGCRRGTARDRR